MDSRVGRALAALVLLCRQETQCAAVVWAAAAHRAERGLEPYFGSHERDLGLLGD